MLFPFNFRKKSKFQEIRSKWSDYHREVSKNLWKKHSNVLLSFFNSSKEMIVGSAAGIMLLVSPVVGEHLPVSLASKSAQFATLDKKTSFLVNLSQIIPKAVRPLTPNEEDQITTLLTNTFGFSIVPELQNIRLAQNYGIIGQEQHLMRFPGDTIYNHFDTSDEFDKFSSYGMAPGLGAYGFFAPSQQQMTREESDREKYYVAIQTFLAPGYDSNPGIYNKFFAFRKMIIVNPDNGKAVVADIGDSGPADWTGKQLGGSPEVMSYLERQDGEKRGPVLYFFIDDPLDKVPLGPVTL